MSDFGSRYLTLALRVRRLTDALTHLVEEGKTPPGLATSLKQALASLESAGERTSVKALRERGAFGHYENVVTMNEIARDSDRKEIVQKLSRVIRARSRQQRRNSAIDAIRFFDALERRALYHHTHPPANRAIPAHK